MFHSTGLSILGIIWIIKRLLLSSFSLSLLIPLKPLPAIIISVLKFRKDRTVSWWICLSFTIIIIIFGILTLIKPDLITKLITQIAGAALIIDTLITLIVTRKSNKVLLIKEQN